MTTCCCSNDSKGHIATSTYSMKLKISSARRIFPRKSPPNCPVPWGSPPPIHGYLRSMGPNPNRNLDRFGRFSTVHGCDQTDTDTPRYIGSNRPHMHPCSYAQCDIPLIHPVYQHQQQQQLVACKSFSNCVNTYRPRFWLASCFIRKKCFFQSFFAIITVC